MLAQVEVERLGATDAQMPTLPRAPQALSYPIVDHAGFVV